MRTSNIKDKKKIIKGIGIDMITCKSMVLREISIPISVSILKYEKNELRTKK